jgi:hypothetical protein
MFFLLLMALVLAATIHVARLTPRTRERSAEIVLLYLLVGYCGVPMLLLSVAILASPGFVSDHLGLPTGGSIQAFAGWAYLAMSLIALLAIRYRGVFLIGPAIGWAVFFAGATFVHLGGHDHPLSHHLVLRTFATHGLISVFLGLALLGSGLVRRRA